MKTRTAIVASLALALMSWACSENTTAPDLGEPSDPQLLAVSFEASTDIGKKYVTETEIYRSENNNRTVELVFNAPIQGEIAGYFSATISSEVNHYSQSGKQHGEGTIELNDGRIWKVELNGYMAQQTCSGIMTAFDQNGNKLMHAKYAENCGSQVGDFSRQLSLKGEIYGKPEISLDPANESF